jgi:APA family basic amino acid/polyamine antiporter
MTVAAALALGFALLQWRGVRAAGRAQEVTSLAKALLLLALAAACFILPAPPRALAAPAANGVLGAAAMVAALQAVIYTYDGWTGVVYFGGEVRDPGREIPRAMFGGVLAMTALYLLLNLAFLRVLPLHSLAGEALAAGAVARALFGALGDPVIRAVVVIGLLSSAHAFLLMAPRVLFAMARDGLVPERAAVVNPGGTPTGALAASLVVVVLFIASGTFDDIIAVLAFFFGGQLRRGLRRRLRAPPPRAACGAPVPRLGLPLDHGARPHRVPRFPDRRRAGRHPQQRLRPPPARRQLPRLPPDGHGGGQPCAGLVAPP